MYSIKAILMYFIRVVDGRSNGRGFKTTYLSFRYGYGVSGIWSRVW